MYDPTRPLVGQEPAQSPVAPTGNISREEFEAKDNARLQRKFGMSPQPASPQVEENNLNQTPSPNYVESNPFDNLSEQDRSNIINSYLQPPQSNESAGSVVPAAIGTDTSIDQSSVPTANEEDMFGGIFNTDTSIETPEVPVAPVEQPSNVELNNKAFTEGIVNASLNVKLNPNDVFAAINNLSHEELVGMVAEKMQRNSGVNTQQRGSLQPSPQAPANNSKLSYLDKLAQTPIVLGGGEEQVPVVSSNTNGYGDYDEY